MTFQDILLQHISILDYESFCIEHLGAKPFPEQLTIANSFDKETFLLVLMSRQAGKSWTISSKTLQWAITHPGKKILIFAPAKHQAIDIIFGNIKNWIERSEFLMSLVADAPNGQKKLYTDHLILKNDTTVWCLSASEKSNIVGFTGDLIILDEAQSISDMVVYRNIEPMLGSIKNPKYIKIGTPRGKNHFYESWRMGKNDKVWKVIEYPWNRCSRLNKDMVDLYRKTNPHFNTEYELQWMNNVSAYFSRQELDDTFREYPIRDYELMFEEGRGNKVYREVYCGIDWGKVQDSTVVSFLVNESGLIRCVGIYTLDGDYRQQIKDIIKLLRTFNPMVTYMDATGSTSESLSDLLQGIGSIIEPIKMTNKFKATVMYDNLKRIINYRMLALPKMEELEKQFYELELTIRTSAQFYDSIAHPDNGHDDMPDSLALACLGFKELIDEQTGSMAYKDNNMDIKFRLEEILDTVKKNDRDGNPRERNFFKSGFVDMLGDDYDSGESDSTRESDE